MREKPEILGKPQPEKKAVNIVGSRRETSKTVVKSKDGER